MKFFLKIVLYGYVAVMTIYFCNGFADGKIPKLQEHDLGTLFGNYHFVIATVEMMKPVCDQQTLTLVAIKDVKEFGLLTTYYYVFDNGLSVYVPASSVVAAEKGQHYIATYCEGSFSSIQKENGK